MARGRSANFATDLSFLEPSWVSWRDNIFAMSIDVHEQDLVSIAINLWRLFDVLEVALSEIDRAE